MLICLLQKFIHTPWKKEIFYEKKNGIFYKDIEKLNELIKKATFNLNNKRSAKYGYSPEQIEEQAVNPKTGKKLSKVIWASSFDKI